MAQSDRFASQRPKSCRAALLLAGGLILAVPFVGPLAARAEDNLSRDEAKQKLDATEEQLKSSRAQEQGLAQDVATLNAERARLNSELIAAAQKVQESEAKLSATETKLADLTDQVNVIKNSITERKETIVKMLSAMQRMGRTPPPALVTRRDDALAVVRSAMLLAQVFPELKYQADNLSHELEGLVTLEGGIRDQRDAEKSERDRLAQEQTNIDQLLAEKKTKLAQSEAQLTSVREAAAAQAATVTELNDLITKLDAQIARAEVAQYDAEVAAEQALRAREQQEALATPDNEKVIEIKPDRTKLAFASPDRMKPAMPFEEAKGSLPLPAQGKWVKHFGDADATGVPVKGVSLETRAEARITAPADGWVVYAGPFRSYGQLLILNAGGGYHVLLAGMNRIDVSLGQFVLAGEPVAVMGTSPPASLGSDDNSRPVLYVEIRKDGKPIDPDPWWAGASEKVQG
jgi:septal ring factor EnvC (AmiA/AmiB activator)